MTRTRKITKINIGINVPNDDSAENILDKSVAYANLLNKRTVCNNKNKRIILTLKRYPNLSLKNYGHLFEGKTSNISTQTDSTDEQFEDINKGDERQLKYNYSLLRFFKRNHRNRGSSYLDSILNLSLLNYLSKNYKKKEILHRNIIISYKTENMIIPNTLQSKKKKHAKVKNKRIKIQTQQIFGTKYPNRKYKSQFQLNKVKRKSIDTDMLKNKVYSNFYHQLIDKIGNYGLYDVVKWSSKLFKVFLDLGNFKKFYKYIDQRCQSFNNMCNCLGYRQEIDHLVRKINQLESRFNESQSKIKEQQNRFETTDDLDKKMEELELKLESYYSLKSELAGIKKQLNGSFTNISPPIPPPLPPPPPPLPTFSQTKISSSKSILKALQKERKLNNHENSRPIITLEDILNVKLKKIAVTRN
ncbi:uncharacterized protein LOC123676729 isoform X2 [Harmonia axyridis]|uniref:uncharacterized protein LOC123676729 isoform X2 n=1 Tax=Harmonia axyridis TaxID=115357 RepID=UPI001E27500E|nr:uncharacterized protein LOC123676729 isoform X2 [Harmonia axyridis]